MQRLCKVIVAIALGVAVGNLVRRLFPLPPATYRYRPSLAVELYARICVWIDQTIGWPKRHSISSSTAKFSPR